MTIIISKRKLDSIIKKHVKWLKNEKGGERAHLSGANLSGANLSWADLSGADLSGANLSWADLSGANLSGANLSWANLSGADLSRADLSGANLSGANLSRAHLSGANLSGADLSGADLSGARNWNLLQTLQIDWGNLNKKLTVECMKWDAILGPRTLKDDFKKWKKDGVCPFSGKNYARSLHFQEHKEWYVHGMPKLTLWELFIELCKYKEIKLDLEG